jgi:hypothetical protein
LQKNAYISKICFNHVSTEEEMTSAKVLLYRHKMLKDGSHPILIQFIKNRKKKTVSLGISAAEGHWNDKTNLPL